jgi:ABC-type lipopolysaccharide export system ATPase subunit
MIVDVAYSMSGKDLAVVRTSKTGIANLDDVLEVFRELTEKGNLKLFGYFEGPNDTAPKNERRDNQQTRFHKDVHAHLMKNAARRETGAELFMVEILRG